MPTSSTGSTPNDDGRRRLSGCPRSCCRLASPCPAKVDTANQRRPDLETLHPFRKGDSVRDRPHRRSAVLEAPADLEPVPAALLRALAQTAAAPAPPPPAAGETDLGAWLAAHGIAVASAKPWQGGTLYDLEQCPFSDAHAGGAYAVQFRDGGVHAGCHHDSCGGGRQRWPELRARFEDAPPAIPPARSPPRRLS